MSRAASALCAALVVAAAAYFPLVVIRRGAELAYGVGAYDIYAYFYPNIRYALDSLARGDGLLWNPYQDCGQPFFAFSITGLLYPVNWIFAFLPREAALLTVMTVNLAIAGLGAWWLGREMGLSRPAALAGAFAFAYGGSALLLAAWSPMHIGPYAWMPAALAAAERLLRGPSPRRGALLGAVLAMQLLPGFPQIVVFTYEIIALRVAWELATAPVPRRAALLGWLGFGLALPPLLAAVQFLPSLQLARESVRALPLQRAEIGIGVRLSEVRASVGQGFFLHGALTLSALAVATLGLTRRATRRLTLFYLLLVAVSVLLALGDTTPVWPLYRRLPGGGTFRGPERFLWVTSFALAAACGLGVEAALRRGSWRTRAGGAAALAAGVALFAALPPHTLVPRELEPLGVVIAALALAAAWPRLAGAAGLAIGLAIAANTVRVGSPFLNHRVGDIYGGKAGIFERVRERLTAQDRVLPIGAQRGLSTDFGLMHKSASLYRLPSLFDYEPQASLRYAQYFAFMRTGRPLATVYDWYRPMGGVLVPTLRRPLFDLTATRFIIADESADTVKAVLGDTATEVFRDGAVRVYENRRALPRAFFVPGIERVADDQVLPMLADGRVDPRRTALVGADAAPEWHAAAAPATGHATIVRNNPQTVAVEVEADGPGFLFLADQYDPDWTAVVDGAPAVILRANHAFRLVPVPAGRSVVEFRYRPRSLRLGAALSLASALLVVLCVWRGGGRDDRPGRAAVPAADPRP